MGGAGAPNAPTATQGGNPFGDKTKPTEGQKPTVGLFGTAAAAGGGLPFGQTSATGGNAFGSPTKPPSSLPGARPFGGEGSSNLDGFQPVT